MMRRIRIERKHGMVLVRALVCATMFVWMRGYYAIGSDVMFDSFVITDEWVLGPPELGWAMYLCIEAVFAVPIMLYAWRYADMFGAKSEAWTATGTGFIIGILATPYLSLIQIAGALGAIAIVLAFFTVSDRTEKLFDLWEKGFVVGIVAWVSWRYGAIIGAVALLVLWLAQAVGFYIGLVAGLIKDRYRDRFERQWPM